LRDRLAHVEEQRETLVTGMEKFEAEIRASDEKRATLEEALKAARETCSSLEGRLQSAQQKRGAGVSNAAAGTAARSAASMLWACEKDALRDGLARLARRRRELEAEDARLKDGLANGGEAAAHIGGEVQQLQLSLRSWRVELAGLAQDHDSVAREEARQRGLAAELQAETAKLCATLEHEDAQVERLRLGVHSAEVKMRMRSQQAQMDLHQALDKSLDGEQLRAESRRCAGVVEDCRGDLAETRRRVESLRLHNGDLGRQLAAARAAVQRAEEERLAAREARAIEEQRCASAHAEVRALAEEVLRFRARHLEDLAAQPRLRANCALLAEEGLRRAAAARLAQGGDASFAFAGYGMPKAVHRDETERLRLGLAGLC